MSVIGSLKENPPISPTGASRKVIDDAASLIGKKLEFQTGGDLRELIETRLQGSVKIAPPEERLQYGYLRVPGTENHKFDIVLSPYTGDFHDRFTMAHELGHYFLHYVFQERVDELIINREGTDRAESEANWFAEALLMPADAFEKAWKECEGYLPEMIYRFRVASDLIAHRRRVLDQLKNITEPDGLCDQD